MGEVKLVFCKTNTLVYTVEGEDNANATLQFESCALGSIMGGKALFPSYPERLEIFSKKGSIIWEGGIIKAWNVKGLAHSELPSTGASLGFNDPMAISKDMHKLQILDFIQSIMSNRDPLVSGEEGIKALNFILSVFQSNREGKPIEIT